MGLGARCCSAPSRPPPPKQPFRERPSGIPSPQSDPNADEGLGGNTNLERPDSGGDAWQDRAEAAAAEAADSDPFGEVAPANEYEAFDPMFSARNARPVQPADEEEAEREAEGGKARDRDRRGASSADAERQKLEDEQEARKEREEEKRKQQQSSAAMEGLATREDLGEVKDMVQQILKRVTPEEEKDKKTVEVDKAYLETLVNKVGGSEEGVGSEEGEGNAAAAAASAFVEVGSAEQGFRTGGSRRLGRTQVAPVAPVPFPPRA